MLPRTRNKLAQIAKFAYSNEATLHFSYEAAVKCASLPGCYVECGVGAGAQIAAMALADTGKMIYAFDSFKGIPLGCEHDIEQPGIGKPTHDQKASQEERLVSSGITVHSIDNVIGNLDKLGIGGKVEFIPGWFQNTVPLFTQPIALLRLDGDLYESTKVCLEHLMPLVVPGGYVIIDDYALAGCKKACDEHGIKVTPIEGANGPVWFEKQ